MVDTFSVLSEEKARGGMASLISGVVSNLANGGLILVGVNPAVSTLLTLNLAGNLLTYFLDIMIAKQNFHGSRVSYRDLRTRFRWFLSSFAGPSFHKLIVACIIEACLVYTSFARAKAYCDLHGIHFKLRDAVLAAAIAALSFILVMNILRFNWVLHETESQILNIVVLTWMGLSALVLLVTPLHTLNPAVAPRPQDTFPKF